MEKSKLNNTVLLVVDVQKFLVEGHPYNEITFIDNIKKIIDTCRRQHIEVVYVRHDDGVGSTLESGTDGWNIYCAIAPDKDEKIIDKRFNSAFRQTGLKSYLDSRQIENIILVGMQTEYCIDATCKVAFEYGYRLTIPQNCTSTFDNSFFTGKELCGFYENMIWHSRYADIVPIQELIERLTK